MNVIFVDSLKYNLVPTAGEEMDIRDAYHIVSMSCNKITATGGPVYNSYPQN